MVNLHGLPDTLKEIESINFDLLPSCILATNGLSAPASGLAMLSVAATGYVRRATDLLYVMQPAATVTVSSTEGNHWLALTADTWTTIAGWTRMAGTHFVEQANATQPPAPDGAQLVAHITVTGANIAAVTPVLSPPLSRQNSNNVDITGGRISLGGHASTGVLDVQGSVVASDLANQYYGVRVWPVAPAGATRIDAVQIEPATGAAVGTSSLVGLHIANPPTTSGSAWGLNLDVASGTSRYNMFASGTAPNYFAGNLGIGTTPTYRLHVEGGDVKLAGCLGVGADPVGNQKVTLHYPKNGAFGLVIRPTDNDAGGGAPVIFNNVAGAQVGSIQTTAAATSFNTSSDVRLKHAVQALSNALAAIQVLKPVRFRWNADDSADEGFLAHELQQVLPHAVTGEPDAVNPDGSVRPQQVDHSKIVVWLVSAVQELAARLDAAGV